MKNGFGRAMHRLGKSDDVKSSEVTAAKARHHLAPESGKTEIWQLVGAPNHTVYAKAFRVVGELFDTQRRTSTTTTHSGEKSTPDLRRSAANNRVAKNTEGEADEVVLVGRPSDVSLHPSETNVGERRKGTIANTDTKSDVKNEPARLRSQDGKDTQACASSIRLKATMEDIKTERWLELGTQESNQEAIIGSPSSEYSQDDSFESTDEFEVIRRANTTPDLDDGYQTSDSELSVTEEIVAQYLTPGLDALGINSFSPDSRFETLDDNTDLETEEICVSRFSWDSSKCSDYDRSLMNAWWKPKPLNIQRKNFQLPPAPPIPMKNPLRLLRRISKNAPQGFGETAHKSRNKRHLHLDLAMSRVGASQVSFESPESERMRAHAQAKADASRRTSRTTTPDQAGSQVFAVRNQTPDLAISRVSSARNATPDLAGSHIFAAMRDPGEDLESKIALEKVGEVTKARRSVANSVRGKAVRKSQSGQDMRDTHGHTRGSSEPYTLERRNTSCIWAASMPASGSIKQSCIASVAREGRHERRMASLDINKQLPPLPVALRSS
jgi:hypothetical protein